MCTLSITFVLFALAAPAFAQEPPRTEIDGKLLDWISSPTGDQFAAHYPRGAARKGVEGKATIECVFNTEGMLEGCQILSEEPAGQGFGQAAIAIARYFHAKPLQTDGKPIAGGGFKTRISFKLAR